MDLDFNYMTDEELDELIAQIKEVKETERKAEKLTFGTTFGGQ